MERAAHYEALRTVVRPNKMSVLDFWRDLERLNDIASLLPGASPELNCEKRVQVFFNAQPTRWKESFGVNPLSSDFLTIFSHFIKKEAIAQESMTNNLQNQSVPPSSFPSFAGADQMAPDHYAVFLCFECCKVAHNLLALADDQPSGNAHVFCNFADMF